MVAASTDEPKRSTYTGLFLTTLSLLQFELFLTRIFSVTMWYHFAFMAISLAMFGLAAGAIFIELMKKGEAHAMLANFGLLFALTSAICFAAQLYIPVDPETEIVWTALAFILAAIPFVFAGMVVCVALTRFPRHTAALYAADLAGSAAGCILTIPILNHIHAPTAVILNAGIAALAAFAWPSNGKTRWIAGSCGALLLSLGAINQSVKLVDLQWLKGGRNSHDGLYEKWNAFSRIHVRELGSQPVWMGTEPPVSCEAGDRPALFGYRFRRGNSDHEIRRKSERRRASQIRCDGACTLPAKPHVGSCDWNRRRQGHPDFLGLRAASCDRC